MSIVVEHQSLAVEATSEQDLSLQAAIATMRQEAERLGIAVRLYPDKARRYNEAGVQLAVVPANFEGGGGPLQAQLKTFRTLEASWNERAPEPDLTVRLDYVWNPEVG